MITASSPEYALPTSAARGDAGTASVHPLLRAHLLLYGRYRWALLLGVALALGGAVATWVAMPPRFQVTGYVRVKPYVAPVLTPTDQNGVMPMFETFVGLQVSLLQSQRVMDQASLNPEWKAVVKPERKDDRISADALTVQSPRNSEIIAVSYTAADVNVAATAVRSVLKAYEALNVDSEGENNASRLQVLEELRTSYSNQKRNLGEQILALASQYGSDDLQSWYQFKLSEQNKLESELQQVQLDISVAQAESLGQPGVEPSTRPMLASSPSPGLSARPPAQTVPAVLTREDVSRIDLEMRDDLAEELRRSLYLTQLQTRLGANHPDVVAARANLQVLEDRINALVASYQAKAARSGDSLVSAADGPYRPSLTELRERESNIRVLYEKIQAETKALGQQDLQIRKLKSDRDGISRKLDETSARIDQINLEAATANRISILTYGESPTAPLPNKRLPLAVAVGLLGFALGVGLVSLRGCADARVASLLHVQRLSPTLNVLGTLPALAQGDSEDPIPASNAAFCVHQIRSLLETGSSPQRARAFAITSPCAGDGKTSLTLSLGLSFAASGSRTLLIDWDLVGGGLTRRLRAVVSRRLGGILQRQGVLTEQQLKDALRDAQDSQKKLGQIVVERGYATTHDVEQAVASQTKSSLGVLDALGGERLDQCIAPTAHDNLYILPRGHASADQASQLSAKALRRLMRQARAAFDVILLDTGPLLGSPEAAAALRETDEVILAIARGTSSSLVKRTVQLVEMLGARLGGVVLNRATPADIERSEFGSFASLRSSSSRSRRQAAEESDLAENRIPRLGPIAAAVLSTARISVPDGAHNGERTNRTGGNGSSKRHEVEDARPANGRMIHDDID